MDKPISSTNNPYAAPSTASMSLSIIMATPLLDAGLVVGDEVAITVRGRLTSMSESSPGLWEVSDAKKNDMPPPQTTMHVVIELSGVAPADLLSIDAIDDMMMEQSPDQQQYSMDRAMRRSARRM